MQTQTQTQPRWITFKVSEDEMQAIELYCKRKSITKTQALREFIRSLPTYDIGHFGK